MWLYRNAGKCFFYCIRWKSICGRLNSYVYTRFINGYPSFSIFYTQRSLCVHPKSHMCTPLPKCWYSFILVLRVVNIECRGVHIWVIGCTHMSIWVYSKECVSYEHFSLPLFHFHFLQQKSTFQHIWIVYTIIWEQLVLPLYPPFRLMII